MLSRIPVAGLLTLLSLPAYCQNLPANHTYTTNAVPDYVLYDHFLNRVTWLEAQANKLKAQGKDDNFMRSWMRHTAGLTTQEESSLKAIAADSVAQTSAIASQCSTIAASGVTPAKTQLLQSLIAQRQQAVQSHMSQLQTAFGAARYAYFDAFVRLTVKFGASAPIPAGFVPKPPGK